MCLLIQGEKMLDDPSGCSISIGLTTIDVSTAESNITEMCSIDYNTVYPVLETYRYLLTFNPTELLIYLEGISDSYYNWLHNQLELDKYLIRVIRKDALTEGTYKSFMNPTYRREILRKMFSP